MIDAAYGTGFRGEYRPPRPPPGTPVLAVDIPSGVDGLTGRAAGRPLAADRTVTFAALKPGLLLADGPELAGVVTVADIGLDTSGATTHVVEPADVARWLPPTATREPQVEGRGVGGRRLARHDRRRAPRPPGPRSAAVPATSG